MSKTLSHEGTVDGIASAPAGQSGGAGGGRPLDPTTRAYFELRFGTDLGAVRLHDDAKAAAEARSLGATAFTLGNHISFGAGPADTASTDGRRLLAHEIAHTIQQRGHPSSRRESAEVSKPDSFAEREAQRAAETAIGGGRVGRLSRAPAHIHRQPAKLEEGQIVVTNRAFPMGSDLWGEAGTKTVVSLPKGALLELAEPHPRGGGQA
ncbi:MAG TPA: DUF4157 domain-containing protein, partial [Enhygromyxa sp.]|nr:DUF4157 domain-containing protein [Enhygromyxa sp.]